MCFDPTWTFRGSHHFGGLPVLTRLRIKRTNVRVTKKVTMNASRQHSNGNRPRPMMSSSIQRSTLETYAHFAPAARRDAAWRTGTDRLFTDMNRWQSPGVGS